MADTAKPVYDQLARFYDRAFEPLERWFLRAWRAETLSLLPEDASVLEVGCGTGANFEFYPPCGLCVSSELSSEMLKIAVPKRRSNLLVRADAQSLPFDENEFDAAFATLVFCSIPDPQAAFRELRRVVRPNGKIVLLEHVRPRRLLGYVFDALNILTTRLFDDHFNRRSADLARESGLKVVEVREKALGAVNLIICENSA
jgi:ubiquinone/menaquinone biosynthesis C-methylase UbiE